MELHAQMLKAQEGDEQAFEDICRRFQGLVKKHAHQAHIRAIAEEAEAEGRLAVVRAVKTYQADRKVPPAGYIESQVKYAIWNLYKKERRRWQNEVSADAGGEDENENITRLGMLAASDDVEAEVLHTFDCEALARALAELPAKQQSAIRLTLIQGSRLADAACRMGVTLQAVHNLRQRGLARLALVIQEF